MTKIPLNKLSVHPDNVRKNPKRNLDELVASINSIGLLNPLTVLPIKGKKGQFHVITGQRRLLALQMIHKKEPEAQIECNELDPKDVNAIEVSLAENIERVDMTAIEEYKAFAALSKDVSAEEIAARFGVPILRVRQRLSLGKLAPAILKALSDEEITLEVAMAFTVTTDAKHQMKVFKEMLASVPDWSRNQRTIRRMITEKDFPASIAIFDLSKYDGEIRQDLFDVDQVNGEPAQFFIDKDKAVNLQQEAFRGLQEDLQLEGWSFVEAFREGLSHDEMYSRFDLQQADFNWKDGEQVPHKYTKADKQKYGVIMTYDPATHEVRILRGYVIKKNAPAKDAPKDEKDPFDPELVAQAFHDDQRSLRHMFFQDVVGINPRLAKEMLVMDMLTSKFTGYPSDATWNEFVIEQAQTTTMYKNAETVRAEMKKKIGTRPGLSMHSDQDKLYLKIQKLPEKDLDKLLAIVVSRGLSSATTKIREDMYSRAKISLAKEWRPNASFLDRYKTKQLQGIFGSFLTAKDAEATFKGAKKIDAVRNMEHFLKDVHDFSAARYTASQITKVIKAKINDWLPTLMK